MNEHEPAVPHRAWILPTLVHGVVGLTIFSRLLMGAPKFTALFSEYNLALPDTTVAFLGASERLHQHFHLVVSVLSVLLVVDGLILWLLGGWSRFEGRLYFGVVLALLLLTWGALEVSLFLPWFKLRQALSR